MKTTLKIALAVLLSPWLISGCGRTEPTEHSGHTSQETDYARPEAPAFTLTDHTGKVHNLADYKGKIVVLEWVNPECPFVVRHYETGTMVNLAEAYADQEVVWLAVNTTSHFNQEKNKEFAEKYDLPYPVLDDHDGTVGRRYDAKTTPHMFVVDKAGRIAYNGAIDDDPQGNKAERIHYVKNAIDGVLSDRPVTTAETKPYGCTVKYAN